LSIACDETEKVNDNRLKAVASNLRRLQGGLMTYCEIVIADSLLHILRGNVLHDYFVRDISRTGHKVSASSQMTDQKLLRHFLFSDSSFREVLPLTLPTSLLTDNCGGIDRRRYT
jgi:hypothetical protein